MIMVTLMSPQLAKRTRCAMKLSGVPPHLPSELLRLSKGCLERTALACNGNSRGSQVTLVGSPTHKRKACSAHTAVDGRRSGSKPGARSCLRLRAQSRLTKGSAT